MLHVYVTPVENDRGVRLMCMYVMSVVCNLAIYAIGFGSRSAFLRLRPSTLLAVLVEVCSAGLLLCILTSIPTSVLFDLHSHRPLYPLL